MYLVDIDSFDSIPCARLVFVDTILACECARVVCGVRMSWKSRETFPGVFVRVCNREVWQLCGKSIYLRSSWEHKAVAFSFLRWCLDEMVRKIIEIFQHLSHDLNYIFVIRFDVHLYMCFWIGFRMLQLYLLAVLKHSHTNMNIGHPHPHLFGGAAAAIDRWPSGGGVILPVRCGCHKRARTQQYVRRTVSQSHTRTRTHFYCAQ